MQFFLIIKNVVYVLNTDKTDPSKESIDEQKKQLQSWIDDGFLQEFNS